MEIEKKYRQINKPDKNNDICQEPEMVLFSDKIEINEKGFKCLFKELHILLQQFIDNANLSSNTKIFVTSNNIKDQKKFIVESCILYFGKAIIMKYCNDNNFIHIDFKNNLYESINEFYYAFGKEYYKFSIDDIYSDIIPPQHLNEKLINVLDKYTFYKVDIDIIGKLYENFISKEEKILLGQVYTPDEVVEYILQKTGYTTDTNIENKKLIDIACGTGAFLIKAVKILVAHLKSKYPSADARFIFETVQKNIWGMDINPFSLRLAEFNLLISTFELINDIKKNSPNYILKKFNLYLTNSINKNDNNDTVIINDLKNRLGIFASGFDYVVGNPPYLEAKKMPAEIKSICRSNFPDIAKGAFDLYFCFIKLALELLSNEGNFGFIIPNKFLVLKSARFLRKYILDYYKIEEITDISNLCVFRNISVYPILLFIKKIKNKQDKVKTYDNVEHLQNIDKYQPSLIAQNDFYKTEDVVFFILPSDKTGINIYEKLSSINTLLKNYIDIRWTISFHKKGIIDKFIFNTPTGKNPKPILGANIYSRDSEVEQYSIKWSGLWIDYDIEKSKQNNNPLPPIEIFETPKLIIRQNAKQLSVAIDSNGKWILKDVYFSGILTQKAQNDGIGLEYIAAILNSKLMNYYYSILFKGGHINGGYLHFLVGYLNALPIKIADKSSNDKIKKMINEINNYNLKEIQFELDKLICKIFDLNNSELKLILNYD